MFLMSGDLTGLCLYMRLVMAVYREHFVDFIIPVHISLWVESKLYLLDKKFSSRRLVSRAWLPAQQISTGQLYYSSAFLLRTDQKPSLAVCQDE